MNDQHKIMVLESTVALRNKIKKILSGAGYEVYCYDAARQALDDLRDEKAPAYAMVLSSYMMPKMRGDEILKQVMEISSKTYRVMMADAEDLSILINAVNAANIHSCLTLPFTDDELLARIKYCISAYEAGRKKENLKKITARQNKQLFQIATNFKKKDAVYARQIKNKIKEIRVLESRIKSAGGTLVAEEKAELGNFLTNRGIPFKKESFGAQFLILKDQIKQILESVSGEAGITLHSVSGDDILNKVPDTNHDKEIVRELWHPIFTLIKENKIPDARADQSEKLKEVDIDEHFELTLNKDNTQASIKVKIPETRHLDLIHVRQFLEKNKIINGVKLKDDIFTWLKGAAPNDEPFVIARGKPAKYPKNAQIKYHFPTDFLHAGKINEDGSINFQDRGEIPYVEADAFLASKILPEEGKNGIDVLGREIIVDAPVDLIFSSGPGTRMSEDGTRIYAVRDGQPHLDAMGNVSVCPEYEIKGDLGFETGDVNFEGNVIVKGAVKQGFKVKCASLTANEIQGAEIDIEGDLNVSLGIMDTELVKVKGSVQAKFVRNSKINSFGDLIIQREIVDSTIYLTGACINENGSIINSQISAKMGVRSGRIGNKASKPSALTVGVDEHINRMVGKIDGEMNRNINTANDLKGEIRELEKEDRKLHAVIAQHAHVQDRSQLQLRDIESKIEGLKASGNMSAYQKVVQTVKEIMKNAAEAEASINEGFERQDEIEMQIEQKKNRVGEIEALNKELAHTKNGLIEFSGRHAPLPEVKARGKIESGTRIFAENSSLTLHKSASHCRIREYARGEGIGSMVLYEMKISEY